jgi:hypothetical protein
MLYILYMPYQKQNGSSRNVQIGVLFGQRELPKQNTAINLLQQFFSPNKRATWLSGRPML